MGCENCTKQSTAVPQSAFEFALAREERTIRRLWILLIIIIALFVGTNAGWIYYESQFADEVYSQTITQDNGDGGINTVGAFFGGDYYGTADSHTDG